MAATILDRWNLTVADLTAIVDANPSLRGMLLGYAAELKLTELLQANPNVSESIKYDDHDRRRKGDRVVVYKGRRFIFECKSLQTNSVRQTPDGWTGRAQVDASDRREVTLPDGSRLVTTCLKVGEFDVLAVSLFAFGSKWRFAFARNRDLPRTTFRRYSPEQRSQLLATLVQVAWPPRPPFQTDVFALLDEMLRERSA